MGTMLKGLLVGVVAVLLGLTLASGASAQGVVVIDEASGTDCNPCSVHIVGESHIAVPSTGMVVSSCQDELFARLYGNGTGELDWVGTAHGGPGCRVVNCAVPTEWHWPITSIAETAAGVERLNTRLCYADGLGAELHCNVSIPISHPEPHRQTFSMLSLCAGGARRMEATWQTESAQVELVHTAR